LIVCNKIITTKHILCYDAPMDTNVNDKTSLILHGHFYQPPRENPLVDLIPKQSSAKPYSNWNERIYDDCYRANAFSRYLDTHSRVRDIVNNYKYISFNFGPTLLSWLQKYHPTAYEKILEADKASIERLGFGNAIAQSYNHTILPLSNPRDSETQILWGIDDFTSRFKRAPLGLWLPETAISSSVVSQLAKAGISFVILSPWQCKAIETSDKEFKSVDATEVPYWEPFILEGTNGSNLSAFFYYPDLASSISFGHMLRDADAMYNKLLEMKNNNKAPLIHTATDGEIYGHHEPFGDMALAALIRKVTENNSFELTNYSAYLEKNRPKRRAVLHDGEDKKGSSWSCSHGVSRWYKDCGCHTGGEKGWNQKWRTPLREAFDNLATKIDAIYDESINHIFKGKVDPITLLNGYSSVISKREDALSYIKKWEKIGGITITNRQEVATLLEGQRLKHYSFTSCGWFFSDIAGIEPTQNIFFGVRALSLYSQFTKEDLLKEFLNTLSEAKSNKKYEGSGKNIALHHLEKDPGEVEAAAYFLMNQNFGRKEDYKKMYGKYELIAFNTLADNKFACEVTDTVTLKSDYVVMDVNADIHFGYQVSMQFLDTLTKKPLVKEFGVAQIPEAMLEEAYKWIELSLSRISDEELKHIAEAIRHYSLLSKSGNYAINDSLYIENMGTCLRALRSLFTTPDTLPWTAKRESICYLLGFIKRKGRRHENEIVDEIFTQEIERVASVINSEGFTYDNGSYLLELLKVASTQEISVSTTIAQEALYDYIIGDKKDTLVTPLTVELINQLKVALNFSLEIN